MYSASTIDFAALLKPIGDANPSGTDLRYDPAYTAIREARRAGDGLPQGDWKREVKVSNWPRVITLTTEVIAVKSKDLQVAAWLTEALAKEHGYAGLRDGLRLLRELQEQFWDSLHPQPEDGSFDNRSGVLEGLNSKLPVYIGEVAITRPTAGTGGYSFLQYQESRVVSELGHRDAQAMQAAIAEGKLTSEQFDNAVEAAPRSFYERLLDDLNQCVDEYEKLTNAIDAKFGADGPSLMAIKAAIDESHSLVESILRKKREFEGDLAAETGAADTLAPQANGAKPPEPQNRADALRRLQGIADFFLRTEPQSPVAYLVQRAVRWGQMPLGDWLIDVIKDPGVLANLRETLGIKNPEDKAG